LEFASAVVEPIGSEHWKKTAIDAINGTLRSQGFAPIRMNDPTLLPTFYDIAFINTDVDLQQITARLSAGKSCRICLYGPPGTGKTAFARWAAEGQGYSLARVNASDVLGSYVGQTEQNLRRAFEHAERTRSMLLFDEIDSYLYSRDGAMRRWEVTQVNEFLAQLECFSGMLFATTNNEKTLDHAALRRFDIKIRFNYLRVDQMEALVRACCDELDIEAPCSDDLIRLNPIGNLALGDFATVLRQSRFTGVSSAQQLIDVLIAECSIKQDTKQSIGFE
jgi:SpoVK/Ycf46/Vps4 family AAA+-type ATPase